MMKFTILFKDFMTQNYYLISDEQYSENIHEFLEFSPNDSTYMCSKYKENHCSILVSKMWEHNFKKYKLKGNYLIEANYLSNEKIVVISENISIPLNNKFYIESINLKDNTITMIDSIQFDRSFKVVKMEHGIIVISIQEKKHEKFLIYDAIECNCCQS
jgi:hypothetical protein